VPPNGAGAGPVSERYWDLLVVGGGLAGLTAAYRAAELGLSVAVLERGNGPAYPCNSRVSSGILHVAGASPDLPPAELASMLAERTFGTAQPELVQLLARNAARARGWLMSCGARIERVEVSPGQWQGDVLGPVGYRTSRMEWSGMGPDLLLKRLRDALLAAGGEFHQGCDVVGLIMSAGAVTGVEARTGSGAGAWRGSAVVLADGGFQASMEHLRQHVTPAPEQLAQRGAGTGTGTALSLAGQAGAAMVGLEAFYGHLLSRDALRNKLLRPYPMLDLIAEQGILVDRGGRRFTDEGRGGVDMANRLARLADPASAFAVADSAAWAAAGSTRWPPPPNPTVERSGGTVHSGRTLGELSVAAGIDPDGLAATVGSFNTAVRAGRLTALAVPRTAPEATAVAEIGAAPFYALPVCPGITFTLGGPLVNADARVLRADGDPVPGLFAIGSCAGGFECAVAAQPGGPDDPAGGPVGYAGGLLKAVVTGLAAAECASSDHRA
jgi:fumarate reductase flavoprotein subunit